MNFVSSRVKIFALLSAILVFGGVVPSSLGSTPVVCKPSDPCTVAYFAPPKSTWASHDQSLCDKKDGECSRLKLTGYLSLPGSGSRANLSNLSLIVYNHGSDAAGGTGLAMRPYFTGKGFAFFVPQRRGHGPSSGLFHADAVCDLGSPDCDSATRNIQELNYLAKQHFEVKKAAEYMLRLKGKDGKRLIHPGKVAVMGHSFGGMVSMFANGELSLHQAAVSIAGASQSWKKYDTEDGSENDSSISIDYLKAWVTLAKRPMYFLTPRNDDSTRPTIVLSEVAADDNQRYQAAVFSPVPLTGDETAHAEFIADPKQVAIWGPSVVDFLRRFGVH